MSQLYARIFTQILDSSLAEDWRARHVFEDLYATAGTSLADELELVPVEPPRVVR